ncbi:MAG: acyl-CoA/acyl-ACP dehydrogenase [Nocardioidaceae bacterium]|nr:acyl-CoA/acyl-ACP dehydrogenase [Nocardioidaceae bacterium]MCL2613186.1 acyl-CoA/acyl-ACP dehydrogenase [Nocardioidaceae bacterium]
MRFRLSEEQDELVATVRALLTKRADSAAVRAAIETPDGYDTDLWRLMCDQVGVAALAVPEQYDGFGATFFETAIVLEELGRSLAPSPLVATTIATQALLAGGTEDARADLLPRIAAGEPASLVLGDGLVLDADRARILLQVDGNDLVLLDEPRVERVETMDQTIRLARVAGGGTVVGDGRAAQARAELVGAACAAALAVGLCRRALEMTVAYTKGREQFGRPIGSFQALKHRMADMLARTEIARSVTWQAAYALASDATEATADQVHAATAYALDAAADLAAECVQLHGGIAITWEHDAHMVFKRAHALRNLAGTPSQHRLALIL